jgi:transcriptional regulator with XRE-family HTH domain
VEEDFSEGWQARAGARRMANQLELQMRREETARPAGQPLVVLGRYIRRSRRYSEKNQRRLAEDAHVSQAQLSRLERGVVPSMRLERFVQIANALGRLLPLGVCPHDHPCAWQPVRPPLIPQSSGGLIEYLLRQAGEPSDPGATAHHAADVEIGVELDEIGPLAGGEAAAIVDAEHLEGVARCRGDRGG